MSERENKLKELFIEWSNHHQKEIDDETWYKEEINGIKRRNSFVPDGFLGTNAEDQENIDFIFINRESNEIKEWKPSDDNAMDFWMRRNRNESKDEFEDKKEQKTSRCQATKYRNVMRKCIKEINKEINACEEEAEKIKLDNCAYINLNKRGGINNLVKDRQRLSVFKNYITKYSEFLEKEINFIKTEKTKIVILGKINEDIDNEILKILKKSELEIYRYDYHPSARNCYKGNIEPIKTEVIR